MPRSRRPLAGAAHLLALVPAAVLAVALSGSGAAAASTSMVAMVDFAYQPESITIAPGDSVTWRQVDIEQHTVSSCEAAACPSTSSLTFESGILNKGESFSMTFQTPGTYEYYCRVHTYAIMHGLVVVAAPAASAATPSPVETRLPTSPGRSPATPVTPAPTPSAVAVATPSPARTEAPATTAVATGGIGPQSTAPAGPATGGAGLQPAVVVSLIVLLLAALVVGAVAFARRRA